MRRFNCAALAAVAVVGFASVACAADMPMKAAPMVAPVAAYNWTGCYIGANIGYGWSHNQFTDITVGFAQSYQGSHTATGVVGGGQFGCDYQFASNWIVGVQGMFDGADIKGSHLNPNNSDVTITSRSPWFATVTGRIGYALQPTALLYIKGGGAWVRDENSYLFQGALNQTTPNITIGGWTVGGGLEYIFMPKMSVFVEYDYMDFGTRTVTFTRVDLATFTRTIPQNVQTVLVGINYRFGDLGKTPVSAKY